MEWVIDDGKAYLYLACIEVRASRVADNQHILMTENLSAFVPSILTLMIISTDVVLTLAERVTHLKFRNERVSMWACLKGYTLEYVP